MIRFAAALQAALQGIQEDWDMGGGLNALTMFTFSRVFFDRCDCLLFRTFRVADTTAT